MLDYHEKFLFMCISEDDPEIELLHSRIHDLTD